jgi:hypothetical protein
MPTGRADRAAIPPFWSLRLHGMPLSSLGFPAQSAIDLEAFLSASPFSERRDACTDNAVVTYKPAAAVAVGAAAWAAVERECRSVRQTTLPTWQVPEQHW